MNKTRLSIDSLGESEVERLRESLKLKENVLAEKGEIISSLRQQVADLQDDLKESEENEQVLHQKIVRLTKEKQQRDEDLEAVTHSLKEVDTAYESLNTRYEARVKQVKELFEDLKKTKKELDTVKIENEELKHKNERLTIELELANTRKRQWIEENQENQSARPNLRPQLAPALHFTMADELGEIMDSSTILSSTITAAKHMESPQRIVVKPRERPQQLVKIEPRYEYQYESENVHRSHNVDVENYDVPKSQSTHIVSKEQQYCPKHQAKKVEEEKVMDPIEEYRMRVARANELARRNKLTKPLHQTSYALELDTFDSIEFAEQEIKRGNISKTAALVEAAVSKAGHQSGQMQTGRHLGHRQSSMNPQRQQQHQQPQRQVLMDRVNTTPVAKRVYKKAEAFIV